jgi:hypothetical protein
MLTLYKQDTNSSDFSSAALKGYLEKTFIFDASTVSYKIKLTMIHSCCLCVWLSFMPNILVLQATSSVIYDLVSSISTLFELIVFKLTGWTLLQIASHFYG